MITNWVLDHPWANVVGNRSGRVIPHEFVVLPPMANRIESVLSGVEEVWPLVADEFGRIWDLPAPPSAQ